MVPTTPNSAPLTELDPASWQAHSFFRPLQVWHQLKISAGSYLPKSLLKAAPVSWSLAASTDSGTELRRDGVQMGKQVLSWPGLQQLGGKVAGSLPGLVPLKSSAEKQQRPQVGVASLHLLVAPVYGFSSSGQSWWLLCMTSASLPGKSFGVAKASQPAVRQSLHSSLDTLCLSVCRNLQRKAS